VCGRFLLIAPAETLRRLFQAKGSPNLAARYNIAPTQGSAVIRVAAEGGRELVLLRWGLIPSWAGDAASGPLLINARAESAAVKPSFREAFRRRRCLAPADGFYEWRAPASGKGAKQPYLIARRDGATLAFAGLWERWQGADGVAIESFAIVTTEANAALQSIHPRMPAILEPSDHAAWLDPANTLAGELLRPAPEDALQATAISGRVNSVANDGPEVVAPGTVEAGAPAPAAKLRAEPPAAPPAQGSLL
jgi:putative SOS response-associated peptidase YedK